jgi:hypothetical protein
LRKSALGHDLRACHFKRNSYFFSAHEGTTDIPVLSTCVERDQSVAVLTVRLKSVADILRPLSEYLRAFGAFDFDFIINHEMDLKSKIAVSYPELKRSLMAPLSARLIRLEIMAENALSIPQEFGVRRLNGRDSDRAALSRLKAAKIVAGGFDWCATVPRKFFVGG